MDKRIIMRWWQVPRDEIPTGRDERIEWLFGWWERIDAWIEENRPEDASLGERLLRPVTLGLGVGRQAWSAAQAFLAASSSMRDDLGRVVRRDHRVRLARPRRPAPRRARSRRCRRRARRDRAARRRRTAPGVGVYDDCQLSLVGLPAQLLGDHAGRGGEAAEEEQLLELAALLGLLALELGDLGRGQVAAERRPSRRPGRAPIAALSAATAAPSAITGPALVRASATTGPTLSRASASSGRALSRASAITGAALSRASASSGVARSLAVATADSICGLALVDVVAGLVDQGLLLAQTHGVALPLVGSRPFDHALAAPGQQRVTLWPVRGSGRTRGRRRRRRTHSRER